MRFLSLGLAMMLASLLGVYMLQTAKLEGVRAELSMAHLEREHLRAELNTASVRLAQSQRAQGVAADALKRSQAAGRELAAIKDWIRGNEDAPVPAWFNDLLVRLGFGLLDTAP